jgi:site-specific recombinase XerD
MDLKIQVLKERRELLGHKHSKTTEIYTQVSAKSIGKIRSPLERLKLDEGSVK